MTTLAGLAKPSRESTLSEHPKEDLLGKIVSDMEIQKLSKKESLLAKIGILPKPLEKKEKTLVVEQVEELLQKIGVTPLFFNKILLVPVVNNRHLVFENDGKTMNTVSFSKDISFIEGSRIDNTNMVVGVTSTHDTENTIWRRRNIQNFVNDGNNMPNQALDILYNLQNNFHMPLSSEINVWTPMSLSKNDVKTMVDPIIVLELFNDICIPICRWNPSL